MNNLPFFNDKAKTRCQLDKSGLGFGEIPVFVPAYIEKSKDKEREAEYKDKEKK